MTTVETRAGKVAYTERGSGLPVVMLHATLHDHHDFDPIVPVLAERYRTIAVDWPGHGDSEVPRPPLQPTAPLFADVLEDVVAGLDLRPSVFIGNSVGGFAAARLAATNPGRVAGLVLVNNGGFIAPNLGTRAFCGVMGTRAGARLLLPTFIKSYMKATSENDFDVALAAIRRARTSEGSAMAASMWRSFASEGHDLRARGGDVRAPTLVVWGARDVAIPLRAGWATAAAIKGSRMVTLETGHVVFSSQPDQFLEVVEPFIAEVATAAPPGP